jgi:GNAT superfamily N-acetyltransferase
MVGEGVCVRTARAEDAPAIARVSVDTWRSQYRGLLPDALLAGLSYDGRARKLAGWFGDTPCQAAGEGCSVAERPGAGVVGFVWAGPERDGDPEYAGEVYALYVRAAEQGRGLGRRLMGAASARLAEQGWRSLLVWVLAANPARGFYAALGGRPVREREVVLGGASYPEVGYGWADAGGLLPPAAAGGTP